MSNAEYERGWKARAEYIRDHCELKRKSETGAYPMMLVIGAYAVMFNIVWPTALILFGNFDPWLFLLGIGAVVWTIHLRRAVRRDHAEYRRAEAAFREKWK